MAEERYYPDYIEDEEQDSEESELWFDAVLSKNGIARHIAREFNDGDMREGSMLWIAKRLEEIEAFIGVGNQPSVRSIIDNNTDPEREFRI